MASKNYCWSIGTTSFRVNHLNYKIERQLQLLKQFWNDNDTLKWNDPSNKLDEEKLQKDEKYPTQIKYYNYLKENKFLTGSAKIRDKDARVKTSGLVEIGMLTNDRKLTEVGEYIEGALYKPVVKENIFNIADDSYHYLLQFLKMQKVSGSFKIKPFIAFIYMLEKLDYLIYDEFAYILPLCKNKDDVKTMVENLKTNRQNFDFDNLILSRMSSDPTYFKMWKNFKDEISVTKETFESVGKNGKSTNYDRAYFDLYDELFKLTFTLKNSPFEERKTSYIQLNEYCKNISENLKSYWTNYLFKGYSIKKIDEKFDEEFRNISLCESQNVEEFKKRFFERMHIIKWKANLKDYSDLNRRYFSLTEIVRFEDGKIELDLLPKYYFKDIIDKLLDEDLMLPKDYKKKFYSNISLQEISPEYSINISDVVNNVNEDLKTNLTINNINNYVKEEKMKRFNELIEKKFKTEDLIRLLKQIKKREDRKVNLYVSLNADVPTIFEYILGISWYRISNMKGNILDYMNLSLDADFLPKTHAGGKKADIVYKYNNNTYPKHDLLIEATLSESTGQRKMEIESVSRHLGENIKLTNNINDYALFVAPELDERIILDFRNMKTLYYPKGNGKFIEGLKIIPINIDMIINLLEKDIKYNSIYEWFDQAFKSKVADPLWYREEILKI